MAIHYHIKEALAVELGRLYRAWDWEGLSFGEVRPSNVFNNCDVEIDFTYRGVTRTVAYMRRDVSTLFLNFPMLQRPVLLTEEVSGHQVVDVLNARYGLAFEYGDIEPTTKLIPEMGWVDITMSPKSRGWRGTFRVFVGVEETEVIPDPQMAWALNGSPASDVEGGQALTAAFDYVDFGGRKWASHKTQKLQPLGVSLRAKGDFTLKFRMVALSAGVGDKWQGIFNDASGSEAGQPIKVTCNDIPGKWFAYTAGTFEYNGYSAANTIAPGVAVEVTVRGVNGKYEFYLNDVLSLRVAATGLFDAWTHIGKAGQFMSDQILIADLRWWDTAINMPVLQAQSKKEDIICQAWYADNHWALNVSTGRKDFQRIYPAQQTWRFDYTPIAATLRAVPQRLAPWQSWYNLTDINYINSLASQLRSIDNIPWIASNSWSNYTLYSSWALFNGPTKLLNDEKRRPETSGMGYINPADWWDWLPAPANEEYDNVLCLLLNSTANCASSFRSVAMFHYNNED